MTPFDQEQSDAVKAWIAQAVAAQTQSIMETIVAHHPGFECPACRWPWPHNDGQPGE